MGIRHSGWSATKSGERVNSSGKPSASRTLDGRRVDIDGVPEKYTSKSDIELPPEFWADFAADPVAATAKWTADEA